METKVEIVMSSDYYPFGMTIGETHVESEGYRYGFQGQEEDDETGLVNYKYRMHDPRLWRFFAVDPLAAEYEFMSPYQFAGNKPIWSREIEGLESEVDCDEVLQHIAADMNDENSDGLYLELDAEVSVGIQGAWEAAIGAKAGVDIVYWAVPISSIGFKHNFDNGQSSDNELLGLEYYTFPGDLIRWMKGEDNSVKVQSELSGNLVVFGGSVFQEIEGPMLTGRAENEKNGYTQQVFAFTRKVTYDEINETYLVQSYIVFGLSEGLGVKIQGELIVGVQRTFTSEVDVEQAHDLIEFELQERLSEFLGLQTKQ